MHQKPTYEDYVRAFREGQEAGFDHFFRELYPSLCYYGASFVKDEAVAQDLATDAFLKIWQKRSQFTDASAIRAYLFTIVKNDALQYIARQKKLAVITSDPTVKGESACPEYSHEMIRTETMRILQQAINTLAPECRKVFSMMYIEGKTVREVAEELGVARTTVKTQKARGLAVLRRRLGGSF